MLGAQAAARIGISYLIRVTLAGIAALLVTRALDVAAPIWAVVSAIVVIMPEVTTSIATAGLRVVANLIGAGVGVAIAAMALPTIPSLALGFVAVAGCCRLLGLDAAARSACVALVIVLLRDGSAVLGSSETRVMLVMLGCGVALVVTVVVAQAEVVAGKLRRRFSSP